MHKILKSLLPTEEHVDSFQRLVNAQIEEMRKHDAHMKMVAKDPGNYHPYPAPGAHPDVMAAIVKDGDDYNIEFELIDDEVKPTLEEKKMTLVNSINSSVMKIQTALLPPPLKQRLIDIEFSKIPPDQKDQTAEQKVQIAERAERDDKLQKLYYETAVVMSDIHDLTEENIAKYKLPDFSEFLK